MNLSKQKFLTFVLIMISIYILIILTNHTMPIVFTYLFYILNILKPFIIAFFFAFLLHTLVDKLESRGINRMVAVLFVFLVFIIVIGYLISILIPIVINQVTDLIKNIPELYLQLEDFIDNFWTNFTFIPEQFKFDIHDVEKYAEEKLLSFRFREAQLSSLIDSFNVLVLTPIATFYFLYEYDNIKVKIKKFFRRNKLRFLDKFMHELDCGIGSYFRGLILIMNLVTIISTIIYMFIGLPYPFLFGFLAGYTNIIPIIGPYLGGIPAVLFAITKSFNLAIITTIVIVVIQLVESNIITPYIQSKSIDAHPLLILLAFVFFGKTFGLVGMILSIPLLYIIMLISRYLRLYFRVKRFKKANQTSITIKN